MLLGVRDVARLFQLREETVYSWIAKQEIPAQKIRDNYRFSRVELLEWATARGLRFSPELARSQEKEFPLGSLRRAIERGGIHSNIHGNDKEAVLQSVVSRLRLPPRVDREFLLSALLARESLGTTAIGKGIAIPHVRNPIILQIEQPQAAVCFLANPVDYGALDGQKVTTLFLIASNTVREHLHLLSRLSFVLQQDPVCRAIDKKAEAELLDCIEAAEASVEAAAS